MLRMTAVSLHEALEDSNLHDVCFGFQCLPSIRTSSQFPPSPVPRAAFGLSGIGAWGSLSVLSPARPARAQKPKTNSLPSLTPRVQESLQLLAGTCSLDVGGPISETHTSKLLKPRWFRGFVSGCAYGLGIGAQRWSCTRCYGPNTETNKKNGHGNTNEIRVQVGANRTGSGDDD